MKIIIEEFAGQHEDLRHPGRPPLCRCKRGRAFAGNDSCLYCGRYIEALFDPVVRGDDEQFTYWRRFVRARPFEDAA